MKVTKATSLALAAAPAMAQIPPTEFNFPSAPNNTVLNLGFGEESITTVFTAVQPGALFGIDVPNRRPQASVNTTAYQSLGEYQGQYLVVMVDPDAPTPQDPSARFFLHWLQPNMGQTTSATVTGQRLGNQSEPIVPYLRPSPPTDSSPHRYIFYAFQQPANFELPPAWAGLNDGNRTNFNLDTFITDANLGTPAAANYFYCTNQTNVPATFEAAPGGEYPGGNGEAVTASAVPTVASATGSGAAASATANAASKLTGVSGIIGAGLLGLAAVL